MNRPGAALDARLVSVNIGMPADVSWRGKTVHTGIYKQPVAGPVMVRRLNIDGDGQGDLNGHGGEQRAVMVYQAESYDYWRGVLKRDDLEPGKYTQTPEKILSFDFETMNRRMIHVLDSVARAA